MKGPKPRPLADRFWEKVDKSGECWQWQGARTKDGYGSIAIGNRRSALAHRVSWSLAFGDTELHVLHHCDNQRCVRPDHLFTGSDADNSDDKVSKGRQSRLKGEANGRAKLDADAVIRIRNSEDKHTVLAKHYGVTTTAIRYIREGKNWTHV